MTLSIGFRISVYLHPATLATGLLAFTPAGLSPAEHASLRWTHILACGSLAPGFSDSLASAARHYHGVYMISPVTFQALYTFRGLHSAWKDRLSLVPLPGLTFRRCRIHFMLRAAVLLSFLKRLQRFSTIGHPIALVACYAAA